MPGQKLWSATVALGLRSVRYTRNPNFAHSPQTGDSRISARKGVLATRSEIAALVMSGVRQRT